MQDQFSSCDVCLGGVVKTCSCITMVFAAVWWVSTCAIHVLGELLLGFWTKQAY